VTRIHPTAIVDPGAEVDPTVEIGPYAVVGPEVRLAAGVVLRPHAYVTGRTEVGPESTIYSFASVGEIPQDKKYRGEPTRLVIGARNQIREHVTLSPGTAQGGGLTSIGDDNLLMIVSHVGHDCQIGSHVVMANNVALAGHVMVESYAVLGALSGVHQFCRIGESAMLGGLGGVSQDVAPYAIAQGNHCRVIGLNRINLERRGFSAERIEAVEAAFRLVFRSKLLPRDAFARVREELPDSPEAEHLVAFLEKSERGFCRMR
jgi:UDP-N-acetylglucosamine acyltransferase